MKLSMPPPSVQATTEAAEGLGGARSSAELQHLPGRPSRPQRAAGESAARRRRRRADDPGAGRDGPCARWHRGSGECFVLSSQTRLSSAEVTPALYVTMEILSNWGNALQVGLTELQFFCLGNKKLFVSPHDLDIRNADCPGNLGALVNGRVKVSRLS